MAIKKTDLYRHIWKACDDLRGGMDASQYKDYILTLLFVKYVSDKYGGVRRPLVTVPEDGSFSAMLLLKGKSDIGDKMNKIIHRLAETNDLVGVITLADWNDDSKLGRGQDMVDRLSKLIAIFEDPALDFSRNRADGDDLLGDAYEYLMRNFATEAGKSKGQFYTPAEVSRIMAKLIGINRATSGRQTVYDPTCGSGSLLIRASDETGVDLTIYGQEKDNATAALARMNMVLHNKPEAEIWQDNTLTNPHWTEGGRLKQFDFAVANPPFSDKSWTTGLTDPENKGSILDPFERFTDGVPPAKNGDFAYLLHLLRSLKSTGRGAIILPHGVLFRGNAEAGIRRNLIRRGYIQGIIGLPANLFYGTNIAACILVLDKEHAATRRSIFMIDASRGYRKDGAKNRLREQDIYQIVETFTHQIEIAGYSRLVGLEEIEANEYNLNIPRYIDSSEPEDLHDIEAHLRGGIPLRDVDALDEYWQHLPGLREVLFEPADRPGYLQLRVESSSVRSVISTHEQVIAFQQQAQAALAGWRQTVEPWLCSINADTHPKILIRDLGEEMVQAFTPVPLIDRLDLYQQLMDTWATVMQDDVYMLVESGWVGAARLRCLQRNEKDKKENADLVLGRVKYKADLIPPVLIAARFFAAQVNELAEAREAVEELARRLEEMAAEHGGDEGALADGVEDNGALNRSRLLVMRADADGDEELALVEAALQCIEDKKAAESRVKTLKKALDEALLARYERLNEAEIITLVVEDKWLAAMQSCLQNELDEVLRKIAGRLSVLADRYVFPLPVLKSQSDELLIRVNHHLERMGFYAI